MQPPTSVYGNTLLNKKKKAHGEEGGILSTPSTYVAWNEVWSGDFILCLAGLLTDRDWGCSDSQQTWGNSCFAVVLSCRLPIQSVEKLHRTGLWRRLPVCSLPAPHHHHCSISLLWKERRLWPSPVPSDLPGPPSFLQRSREWPVLFCVYCITGN